MSVSPAILLKAALLQLGLVTDLSPPSAPGVWPCYVGSMPDDPHSIVSLFDMGGTTDGRIQNTGQVVTHPGIHIQIRAQDYLLGYNKAVSIRDALDQIFRLQVVVATVTYQIDSVTRTSDVLCMGQEREKRREMFALSATATVPIGSIPGKFTIDGGSPSTIFLGNPTDGGTP